MRGRLIALSCAFAAAAVVLLAWYEGGEPPPMAPPEPTAPAPNGAAATASVSQSPAQPQAPLHEPAASSPPNAPSAASAVAAPASKPTPPQAVPAVQSTFALSSDHRTLIQGTLLARGDLDRLENEPRDDAWATEAERLIRQELARHGSAADFDVIAVDCRQTLCAIQAFSYGESGHRRWVVAIDEVYQEALASAFDSVNTAFPSQGSNRAPVLTFLHRKPVARAR